MTEPRPLPADDYETLSFRIPRKFCASARIKERSEASGQTREEWLIACLRTALGIEDQSIYRGRR